MYALHTTDTHARSRMYCEYIVKPSLKTRQHTRTSQPAVSRRVRGVWFCDRHTRPRLHILS
jgi:hypothetical protein